MANHYLSSRLRNWIFLPLSAKVDFVSTGGNLGLSPLSLAGEWDSERRQKWIKFRTALEKKNKSL